MQTPVTASPLYLYCDPDPAYIILNGTSALANGSTPGTLQISSVTNRAGVTGVIAPDTSTTTTQPPWSRYGILGPFYTLNWPGSYYTNAASPALTGSSGFQFNGTSYLSCDSLASDFSGTSTGVTVVCVLQPTASTASGQIVWSLSGNTGNTLKLGFTSAVILQLADTAGGGQNVSITLTANTVYVVTASRSTTGGLMLRATAATASTVPPTQTSSEPTPIYNSPLGSYTSASQTFNTFTIGANNTGTTASPTVSGTFLNANLGQLLMFGISAGQTVVSNATTYGCADILEVESDLLVEAGILLGSVYNES